MLITDRNVWARKETSFRQPDARIAVISDFDRTLTAFYHEDGRSCATSPGCMRLSELMTPEYREEANALFDKYIAYEAHPEISLEEKARHMQDWVETECALMFREGLTKVLLRRIARDAGFVLRQGAREFITMCNVVDVPFVVMSAGIGDVIHEVLHKEHLSDSVELVANFLTYDEGGRACGLRGDPIHIFNKHLVPVATHVPELTILPPTHIIVLGDLVADSTMANLFPNAEPLRIGFLDDATMERLPEYERHFDMVLFGNSGFGPVHTFLENTLSQKHVAAFSS